MSECCIRGFEWDGTPKGAEEKIAGLNTYVIGKGKRAAILVIHDLYGWTFRNLRLLADHFSKDVDATVYLPDFFGGEVLDAGTLNDYPNWEKLNLPAFLERNSKAIREPEMLDVARVLRSKYDTIGAVGYCYGGWGAFRLGSKSHNPPSGEKLVNCISTAHPSQLTKEEVSDLAVPVQLIAPEHDPAYTAELKKFTFSALPTSGVAFDYQHFPGSVHGFAARTDTRDINQTKALERATFAIGMWMKQWLYLDSMEKATLSL